MVSSPKSLLSIHHNHHHCKKVIWYIYSPQGFLGSSAGKECTCNTGDSSSIPGSGSSPGEGIGYPLHYSWASLVAQMVKNPPAMQETCVRSLGWGDPWRRAWQPTPIVLPGESPWTKEPGGLQSMVSQRIGHDWTTKNSTAHRPQLQFISKKRG